MLRAQEVAKVVKNVARVLQVTGRLDVPFYLGSDEPLIGAPIDAAFFHGQDGLGDVPHVPPTLDSIAHSPLQGIAALKLIQARACHCSLLSRAPCCMHGASCDALRHMFKLRRVQPATVSRHDQ